MSDGPQGPGWWLASDGKWYPPQPLPTEQPTVPQSPADQPTAQQPSPYDPTATTYVGPPAGDTAFGQGPPTAYGQPTGPPTFPPVGSPPGQPGQPGGPAWGPGASASNTGGSGNGGKIALLIGVIVLVLILAGGVVFALSRPKDVVVEAPTTPSTAGSSSTTTGAPTTKKPTTTTSEEETTTSTTTKKTTTTTSKSSTLSTLDPGDARVSFDSVTAKWIPNTSNAEREQLAKDICAAIDEEGATKFLREIPSKLPAGVGTTEGYEFVGASLAAFCPDHLQDIQDIANGQ